MIGGAALLVIVAGAVFFSNVDYVDRKPAVALGEEYSSKLGRSQIDDAFALYTDGFLEKIGEEWKKTVSDLDTHGVIMNIGATVDTQRPKPSSGPCSHTLSSENTNIQSSGLDRFAL